jgi:ABC-type phosphate transport system auxiliary subunit
MKIRKPHGPYFWLIAGAVLVSIMVTIILLTGCTLK